MTPSHDVVTALLSDERRRLVKVFSPGTHGQHRCRGPGVVKYGAVILERRFSVVRSTTVGLAGNRNVVLRTTVTMVRDHGLLI